MKVSVIKWDFFACYAFFVTESHIVSSCLRLNTEIVLSTTDPEISLHAPLFTIWISNNPVFSVGFWIDSPATDNDWMVEIHPGYTVVLQISVSDAASGFLLSVSSDELLSLFVMSSHSAVFEITGHFGFMVIWKNTLLIIRENSWNIKFSVNNTVSQNFLHHLFFARFSVSTSNEVTFLNFRSSVAILVLSTWKSFSLCLIWSALFCNHSTVFSQISVKERPSSIATFIHIVTLHQLLWTHLWNLFSIFHFKSRFNNLSERYSIAWPTTALISNFTKEIIPFDISEIVIFWNNFIRNVLSILIFFTPLLNFLENLFEIICFITENFSFCFDFGFSLYELSFLCFWSWDLSEVNSFIAMWAIFGVVLLEFTCVGFPSKVLGINKRNSFICFVRGNMMMMSIESLSWLSVSLHSFNFCLNINFNIRLRFRGDLSKIHWLWV